MRLNPDRTIARFLVATACLAGTGLAAPIAAQRSLELLAGLQKGSWELHAREGGAPRRICVRDGSELIQLRHAGNCNRFVVENSANLVTVQYTCRGNGYGRTTIRRETASLVQIDSQGIEGGRPFSISGEARRTGPCR